MPSSKGWVLFKMHSGTIMHSQTGIVRKTGNMTETMGNRSGGSQSGLHGPRSEESIRGVRSREIRKWGRFDGETQSLIINTSSFLSSANLNLHNSKFLFQEKKSSKNKTIL